MNKTTFSAERDGKGTKEWADANYNICLGCQHDCLYCYARAQRCRFDPAMRGPGGWEAQRLNSNRLGYGTEVGSRGVVMFPTSHDITPDFLPQSLTTLNNLLAKNQVLIVSKPHLSVIKTLCRELKEHKSKILFRFTIGSLDAVLCKFWEPGAPPPAERVACLRYAFEQGYATSVSCEPMLSDRGGIVGLVGEVEQWVTDTIWIGKMQRCPGKYNAHVKGFGVALALIKSQQTDTEILKLVEALQGNGKVRWKDSIKAVMGKKNVGGRPGRSRLLCPP